MNPAKYLFIDRDGTLIVEPEDKQIDHLEKLAVLPFVIPNLLKLLAAGYQLVMVSNQDGLGTPAFPVNNFSTPQNFLVSLLKSQGVEFSSIRICPHRAEENCHCRKPNLGLISDILVGGIDVNNSFVIGDRPCDMQLAENIGVKGFLVDQNEASSWPIITNQILFRDRVATVNRKTKETEISCVINLDHSDDLKIETGINFLNHMLEQFAFHGRFSLSLKVSGDLHVDDHHTIEDVALVLGEAMRLALGSKKGIGRYGFQLPMDDAIANVALDLSGRAFCKFEVTFKREKIGDLASEMIRHFFISFAHQLGAALHISADGKNEHHLAEVVFKSVGRCLNQAIKLTENRLPTTKGLL